MYTCFGVGEGLCFDNAPGSFGRWTFGIDENTRQVNLWSPSLQVVWSHCSEASHVCVAVETGYDPQMPTYSVERPEMFFYDDKAHTYTGELKCDGTDGEVSASITLTILSTVLCVPVRVLVLKLNRYLYFAAFVLILGWTQHWKARRSEDE